MILYVHYATTNTLRFNLTNVRRYMRYKLLNLVPLTLRDVTSDNGMPVIIASTDKPAHYRKLQQYAEFEKREYCHNGLISRNEFITQHKSHTYSFSKRQIPFRGEVGVARCETCNLTMFIQFTSV